MPCASTSPLGKAPLPKPTRIITVPITSIKIRVIVNPSAAAGNAGKKIPELHRLLERHAIRPELVQTEYSGHAVKLARQAVIDGVDVIAAMGGDGTFSEVAQAYVNGAGLPTSGPALALIPAGTGGDLRRSLGLDNDLSSALSRIVQAQTVPLDLGVATMGLPEAVAHRAFLNVASVGISGLACHLTNTGSKFFGGKLTFYTAAIRATLAYRNVPMTVSVDGQLFHEGPVYLAAIANGRYFGGGMHIAPAAQTDDGLFDLVLLGDYSPWAAIGLSRAIYTGAHLARRQTRTTRGRDIEIRVDNPKVCRHLAELDGEVPENPVPLRARIHRSAIRLCV